MTPQEILAILSRLESELNEVASARLLVEQTANSYKEVQKELCSFVGEFQIVINSLNTVAKAFDNENQTLSNDIQNSIRVVKGQLDSLNTAFANQCNSIILKFMESINSSADSFKDKTVSLFNTYESHNNVFKDRIDELTAVHNSLIKATETILSLKSDVANLQQQLIDSQKDQDKTLEKIATDLEKTGTEHAEILSQIASDLKTSQDSQDVDLANLKDAVASNAGKLDKIISEIRVVASAISEKSTSLETSISTLTSMCKTNRTLIVVNILITLVAVAIVLLK